MCACMSHQSSHPYQEQDLQKAPTPRGAPEQVGRENCDQKELTPVIEPLDEHFQEKLSPRAAFQLAADVPTEPKWELLKAMSTAATLPSEICLDVINMSSQGGIGC